MTTLSSTQINTFDYTGQIEIVTVGVSGYYDITADGAQGGTGTSNAHGGLGAMASGEIFLTAGAQLEIVVGGMGGSSGSDGGGGGGGSFVIELNTNPAINTGQNVNEVNAGGGGGGSAGAGGGGRTQATGGTGGNSGGGGGVNGAAAGQRSTFGGGGGGFTGGAAGHAGRATGTSFAGGRGVSQGGGGGFGGGGGGGISGGGGGGGSFVNASAADVSKVAATHSGNGLVTIAFESQPCYCRGTLIAVANGEVPVEALAIGDEVVTVTGTKRPIKWIGRRSYGGRFAMGRTDILPICIKAGALDDNVPKRDLWVSPHHAMYLEGALIEAKDLVNGVSVVQAETVDQVEYFHVELESHDVIIAEGAPSETFIDDDSRGMFHNAHEYATLYATEPVHAAHYCAPRCEEGYEVEAVRRAIALRAGLAHDNDAGALRGFVDEIGHGVIKGWAQNAAHPEAPVCLDVYAHGRQIGQVLANRYREDLAKAGFGSGRHSFEFAPADGLIIAPDALQVRRSLDGSVLPLAPEAVRYGT